MAPEVWHSVILRAKIRDSRKGCEGRHAGEGGQVPERLRFIFNANGDVITAADLPPANTVRWVASRKAVVVLAVAAGLISFEEVCSRYALSPGEFFSWRRAVAQFGVKGLTVARCGRESRNALAGTGSAQPFADTAAVQTPIRTNSPP
jgi:hypothetical protein